MKLIVLGDELNRSYSFEFQKEWVWFAIGSIVALLLALLSVIYVAVDRGERLQTVQTQLAVMEEELLFDQQEMETFYTYTQGVFAEHAKKSGSLQARLLRLEALGASLADKAGFGDEFDFISEPALGGPHEAMPDESPLINHQVVQTDILNTIEMLDARLAKRETELSVIESLLEDKQITKEQYIAGKPIKSGWLSSYYGKRIDPFKGHVAWHKGVDFAGKMGSEIIAVASGVVVWSGDRYGYGQMVEVNHGNGFSTRYAHNSKNLVKLGDVVSKGQVIAEMGSSGRSTGPHVHFEVWKNGRAVDPARYIYRKTI